MIDPQILTGRVTEFDSPVGIGHISGEDGFDYEFHCVEIADGSREIEVGAQVAFVTLLKLGEREAAAVRPTGAPATLAG